MPAIDWEEKLPQPLSAVRAELGFQPPIGYQRLRDQAPQLLLAA
jgi:hypothetical protein